MLEPTRNGFLINWMSNLKIIELPEIHEFNKTLKK